jgi:hypothetical protein
MIDAATPLFGMYKLRVEKNFKKCRHAAEAALQLQREGRGWCQTASGLAPEILNLAEWI